MSPCKGAASSVSRSLVRCGNHNLTTAAATVCCLQVVDATWEPVEVHIAPHRRSVPLTLDEVRVQLPPHKPWKQGGLDAAVNLAAARSASAPGPRPEAVDYLSQMMQRARQVTSATSAGADGMYWRDKVVDAALTRLTGNQVVNKLQVRLVGGHNHQK